MSDQGKKQDAHIDPAEWQTTGWHTGAEGTDHERLVEAFFTERTELSASARESMISQISECPECRTRFEELEAVVEQLDSWGTEERTTIEAVRKPTTSTIDVEKILREAAHQTFAKSEGLKSANISQIGESRRPFSQPRIFRALAAVFLLGILSWLMIPNSSPPEPNIPLGTPTLTATKPIDLADSFSEFLWEGEIPPMGLYTVTVWSLGAAPTDPALASVEGIDQPRWTPGEELTSGWPTEIEWEARAFSADGEDLGSTGRIKARRRTP